MLIVVSPAKALDFESPLPTSKHSQPVLLARSEELAGIMAGKSPAALSKMMSISNKQEILERISSNILVHEYLFLLFP